MKQFGVAVAIAVILVLGKMLYIASYKIGNLDGQSAGCNAALALNPFAEPFGLFCERDGDSVYIKSMMMGGGKIFDVTRGEIVVEPIE